MLLCWSGKPSGDELLFRDAGRDEGARAKENSVFFRVFPGDHRPAAVLELAGEDSEGFVCDFGRDHQHCWVTTGEKR